MITYNILLERFSKQVKVFSDDWYSVNDSTQWNQLFVVFEFELYVKRTTPPGSFGEHVLKKEYNRLKKDLANFLGLSSSRFKVSTLYHEQSKDKKHWYLEPDSSLTEKSPDGYIPVEIVSPWISGAESMSWLREMRRFVHSRHAITTSATGCHINIRFADDPKDFDWLKLLILNQDFHELYQFARLNNAYAINTLPAILLDSDAIQHNDSLSLETLNTFKERLKRIFHPRKYHATNLSKFFNDRFGAKHGFVEFRAPGNDYFYNDFSQLEKSLIKYLNLMNIATTNQYETEYQLRLVRLFNQLQQKKPPLSLFNKKKLIKERNPKVLEKYLSSEELEQMGLIKLSRLTNYLSDDWIDLQKSTRLILVPYIYWSSANEPSITEFPTWMKRFSVIQFTGSDLKNLTSLKNIPPRITEAYLFRLPIKSLKGLKKVDELNINQCPDLLELKGMPRTIKTLILSNLNISSLTGIATNLDTLIIRHNKTLSSLTGLETTKVNRVFLRDLSGIKNFIGLPDQLDRLIVSECPHVESLKGFPKKIRVFDCDSEFLNRFPQTKIREVSQVEKIGIA